MDETARGVLAVAVVFVGGVLLIFALGYLMGEGCAKERDAVRVHQCRDAAAEQGCYERTARYVGDGMCTCVTPARSVVRYGLEGQR